MQQRISGSPKSLSPTPGRRERTQHRLAQVVPEPLGPGLEGQGARHLASGVVGLAHDVFLLGPFRPPPLVCASSHSLPILLGLTQETILLLASSTRSTSFFGGILLGLLFRCLRRLRKVTTTLLASANRSMKTRCPALLRTRTLASGMASTRAVAFL